jgi:succinate dehydrogenase / fumarate reductase cytochrome b subunit
MHLRHGVSSSLQSLGLIPDRWIRAFLRGGLVLALVVGGGFVLIPIYVYFFIPAHP